MIKRALILVLVALVLGAGATAHAQSPERTESFAYGINAAAPDSGVIGTFAPPSVETLYFLANETSVLSPRRTEIYFWPITNEYRAAWSSMNESVGGTLEVFQQGRQIATIEQTQYTIHFFAGQGLPQEAQIYLGEEAVEANQRFQSEQQAYTEAVQAYRDAQTQWRELVREAQQRRTEGEEVDIPPPPEAPEPFNLFSTGLNQGYPLDFGPGTYQVHVRGPDGDIVPKSRRMLIFFEPRRTAVGYTVIPQARWTTPEEATAPADVILSEPESVLYLEPHVVREYPALAYERLLNPQYPGDAQGREWQWAIGEELREEARLEVVVNGTVLDQVALSPYRVKQVQGGELGYEILPFDPNDDSAPRTPDIVAYRIDPSEQLSAFSVRLVSQDGTVMQGSERKVHVASNIELRRLLFIPVLPLGIGAGILYLRRRQTALTT